MGALQSGECVFGNVKIGADVHHVVEVIERVAELEHLSGVCSSVTARVFFGMNVSFGDSGSMPAVFKASATEYNWSGGVVIKN